METTFDAFNFDNMVQSVGIDPFAQSDKKYATDDRFYTLKKDEKGNGAALIRFLPDENNLMIQKMFTINTTIVKNGKKRFVSEFSPSTIGQPCPFQEKWQELWNAGIKEDVKDSNGNVVQYGAKTFSRGTTYVANIKVINDTKNPENNGKIFLYKFSGAMNAKLESAMRPSADDIALGKNPKQLFNPGPNGNSFRLVAQRGSNNQINYDNSEVVPETSSLYATVEEALNDIKNNTHSLKDLIEPESFMSYDELKRKLEWVTFTDNQPAAPVQAEVPVAEVAQPTPVQPEVQANVAQPAQPTPVEQVAQVAQPAQPAQATPVNSAQGQSLDDMLNELM